MKRFYTILSCLLFAGFLINNNTHAQTVYSEDFDGATTWTLNTVLGAEGVYPNRWYISCEEEGVGAGACGTACVAGDKTLHVSLDPDLGGDLGAAYFETGSGWTTANRRAESADISTVGASGMTLSIDIIGWGGNALDYTELFYSIDGGTSWTSLDGSLTSLCCGGAACTGSLQGLWQTNTYSLPAECEGEPDFRIGFVWKNTDDGTATDPSFAVDNIEITGTVTTPPPTAMFEPDSDTTICVGSSITYTDMSTTDDVISDWDWTFDGGTPASATGEGPHTVSYTTPGVYTTTLEVTDGIGTDDYSITVTVEEEPDAGTDGTHDFCSTDAAADLFSDLTGADAGGVWEPTLTSGTGVFDPGDDSPGTIQYIVSGTACPNDTSEVVVTTTAAPNAGTSTSEEFCELDDPVDLTTFLGSPDAGGSWSPTLDSGGDIFDPSVDGSGTYTYTVSAAPCPDDMADVVVTVSSGLSAGADSLFRTCEDQGTIDLVTLLSADADAGGTWLDDDATGALSGSVFDYSTVTSPGTYNFTYFHDNSAPCENDSATITVELVDCSGLDENSNDALTIYPNPATDVITVSVTGAVIQMVEVYSVSGELLISVKDDVIDVSKLAEGTYVLKVMTDQQQLTSRIVKE